MLFALLAGSFALGQIQVPLTSEQYFGSSCGASNETGYVPFKATLTCTTHPAKTGCVAYGMIPLRTTNGTVLPYECQRDISLPMVPIQDVGIELSGVQFDTSPVSLHDFVDLRLSTAVTSFDPVNHRVEWSTTVNWMDAPAGMVDQFTVAVHGELVWTTNRLSRLIRTSNTCIGRADTCTGLSKISFPANWVYGGTAFSSLESKYLYPQGATLGTRPTELSADISESIGVGAGSLYATCTIGGGGRMGCTTGMLSLVGDPAEVVPSTMGPFQWQDVQPRSLGFSMPAPSRSAMRCGLRQYRVSSINMNAQRFGGIWFGSNSADCGWSPGPVYNTIGLFNWRFEASVPMVDRYDISHMLSATRLPNP